MLFLMILQVLGSNDNSNESQYSRVSFEITPDGTFYQLNSEKKQSFDTRKILKEFPKEFSKVIVELPEPLSNLLEKNKEDIIKKQLLELFNVLTQYKISTLFLTINSSERIQYIDSSKGALSHKGSFFYDRALQVYFLIVARFLFSEGSLDCICIDDNHRSNDSSITYQIEKIRKTSTHLMKFVCYYYLWREKNPETKISFFYNTLLNAISNYLKITPHKYPPYLNSLNIFNYKDFNCYEKDIVVGHEKFIFLQNLLEIIDARIEQFKEDKNIQNTEDFKDIILTLSNIKYTKSFLRNYTRSHDFIAFFLSLEDVKQYLREIIWVIISNKELMKD